MSRVQRIAGDLTIDPTGTINLTSDTVISGNLTVNGTNANITTTNTAITDRVIILNQGEVSAGVTNRYSGIEVDRGSTANSHFVFDENDDKWKVSIDGGSTYSSIMVTSISGTTEVVDDTTPQLGGNLDINGKSIVSVSNANVIVAPNGNGVLQVSAPIRLDDQSAPNSVVGATLLYAGTAGGGGTGVFFVDDTTGDELVSKSKAIVYGLIF